MAYYLSRPEKILYHKLYKALAITGVFDADDKSSRVSTVLRELWEIDAPPLELRAKAIAALDRLLKADQLRLSTGFISLRPGWQRRLSLIAKVRNTCSSNGRCYAVFRTINNRFVILQLKVISSYSDWSRHIELPENWQSQAKSFTDMYIIDTISLKPSKNWLRANISSNTLYTLMSSLKEYNYSVDDTVNSKLLHRPKYWRGCYIDVINYIKALESDGLAGTTADNGKVDFYTVNSYVENIIKYNAKNNLPVKSDIPSPVRCCFDCVYIQLAKTGTPIIVKKIDPTLPYIEVAKRF